MRVYVTTKKSKNRSEEKLFSVKNENIKAKGIVNKTERRFLWH